MQIDRLQVKDDSLARFKAGWAEMQKQTQADQKKLLAEKRPMIKAERKNFKNCIDELVTTLEYPDITPENRASTEKVLAAVKVDLRKKEGEWDIVEKCMCSGAEAGLYKKHHAALWRDVPCYLSKLKSMMLPVFVTRMVKPHEFMDYDSLPMLHRRVGDFTR